MTDVNVKFDTAHFIFHMLVEYETPFLFSQRSYPQIGHYQRIICIPRHIYSDLYINIRVKNGHFWRKQAEEFSDFYNHDILEFLMYLAVVYRCAQYVYLTGFGPEGEEPDITGTTYSRQTYHTHGPKW